MDLRILTEKLLSAGLTAALVTRLDWREVVICFTVLGQGHFFTAYLYQGLAGKIHRRYLISYVLWAALIMALYGRYPFPSGIAAVATAYFALHMCLDELYLTRLPLQLHQGPMNLARFLEMIPVIGVYASIVADAMLSHGAWPGFPELLKPALSLAGLAAFLYFGLCLGGYRPDLRSLYFIGAGSWLAWIAHRGILQGVAVAKFSGAIILYHYFNWYLHYFLGLPGPKRGLYLVRVLTVNGVVLGCYALWGKTGPGWWLFQEQNFYVWTLLHLITSTRIQDLRGIFRLPFNSKGIDHIDDRQQGGQGQKG